MLRCLGQETRIVMNVLVCFSLPFQSFSPRVGTVDEAVGMAASTRIRNRTMKLAKLFIAENFKTKNVVVLAGLKFQAIETKFIFWHART